MRTDFMDSLPEDWQPTARIFAALGDMTRQQILLLFEPGEELSIKEISSVFLLGRSTIVHHLATLEEAGILSVRREGREALYSIQYEVILEALQNLRMFIEADLDTDTDEDILESR